MINRLAAFAVLLALAAPIAASAIPSATTPVDAQDRNRLIPAGTLLRIEMLQTVSSAFNKPGDAYAFQVVDNVMAGDRIAIPAGTKGSGKVLEAHKARMGGEDGRLRVKFDPIQLADGTQVEVAITQASLVADQNEKNYLAGDLDEIASLAIPGFFLVDLLRKGSDVTLGAHMPFHIGVTEDAFLSANP